MPEETQVAEVEQSATEETLDANNAVDSSSTGDANADSSNATEADKSIDDIAAEVLKQHQGDKKDDESETAADKKEEGEGDKVDKVEPDPKADTEKKEETSEEKLPFHDHPRWKEVVGQRDQFKTELEQVKPLAETAKALSDFCQSNKISQQDLQGALELLALSKTDVSAFRSRINQTLEHLDIATGAKLPADLAKDVEAGVLSEARAKELSELRLKNSAQQGLAQTAEQRAEEIRQNSVVSALDTWEASQQKLDPNWADRREMLQERIAFLATKQPARTPQEAIALAEQALKDVKARVAKFVPKPPKRKTLLANGSTTNAGGDDLKIDDLEADLGKVVRTIAGKHR